MDLKWVKAGKTYTASTNVEGDVWKLNIESPRAGYWTIRGWKNGQLYIADDANTLKGAKALAAARVDCISKGF